MKRISSMILTALFLVGFTAIASIAGVKTIRPDQLQPGRTTYSYEQNAHFFRSLGTAQVSFTTVVKLPVGKKIKKILYYYHGTGAGTGIWLYRTKMGEPWETVAHRTTSETAYNITPVEATIYIPKIKSGYTYWLHAVSYDSDSYFNGIKIYYH